MKIKIILAILLFANAFTNAQSLSNTVLGNVGGYQEDSNFGNLHWTVGEVSTTAIGKYQDKYQLSQGFHQTYSELLIVNTTSLVNDIKIDVFPNPTAGNLHFTFESFENINVMITNQIGQSILSFSPRSKQHQLELHSYQNGIYFISIFKNGQLIKSLTIIKS